MTHQPIPPITLTSFVQYVAAVSQPAKINQVKRIKQMYLEDFKQSREAYYRFRKHVEMAKGNLLDGDEVLKNCLERDKENYSLLTKNYNKLFKDIDGKLIKARAILWIHDELSVKVNPELAFASTNAVIFFKLHLTLLRLNKGNLEVIFQMLAENMKVDETAVIADLRGGRIIESPSNVPNSDLSVALRLDAEQFIRTWHLI